VDAACRTGKTPRLPLVEPPLPITPTATLQQHLLWRAEGRKWAKAIQQGAQAAASYCRAGATAGSGAAADAPLPAAVAELAARKLSFSFISKQGCPCCSLCITYQLAHNGDHLQHTQIKAQNAAALESKRMYEAGASCRPGQ
jgi:hypothetical protein